MEAKALSEMVADGQVDLFVLSAAEQTLVEDVDCGRTVSSMQKLLARQRRCTGVLALPCNLGKKAIDLHIKCQSVTCSAKRPVRIKHA